MSELLSPAGDFESLTAAVRSGADAVYVGGKSFSARSGAENFSPAALAEAAAFCRERGVKLYVALNTLIKEGELAAAAREVENAARIGADALIIQDLAVAAMARAVCPELPRHASTQLTAHSSEDVRALAELGFSRVVLSRELSEKEIAEIYGETGCELEVFVHGALCVCFSGRCLMSSFIGGRSGNRGRCAQPCRRLYSAEGAEGYFLSPRDLSLVRRLDGMKRAGVFSFKIEGRMKSPEYVAVATSVFRKAVDGLPLTDGDFDALRGVFSRGGDFTEGWYAGENAPQMMNYDVSNDNISSAAPKELLSRARALYAKERPSVGVDMKLACREGEPLRLFVSDGKNRVSDEGKPPEKAEGAPLTAEKAAERLAKTGGTPYFAANIEAEVGEGLFVPAAELNAMRRDCFERLGELRRRPPERSVRPYRRAETKRAAKAALPPRQRLVAEITSLSQLEAAEEADIVLVPLALADGLEFKKGRAAALPQIILDAAAVRRRLALLPKGTEVYSSSLGGLALIAEAGLTPVGDFGLNVTNSLSAELISLRVGRVTLSPELSLKEIYALTRALPAEFELIAYGRQRVMVSRACLIKGVRGRCDCSAPLALRDKTGAEFTVLGDRETHLNTVLNSRPTFMADRLGELSRTGAFLRLCFTTETAAETAEIIDKYRRGGEANGEFTRGWYYKNEK